MLCPRDAAWGALTSLPRLRRLTLSSLEGGDLTALMSALADSTCAATLEALHLDMAFDARSTAGRWWAPIAGLGSLCELDLRVYDAGFFASRADADAFAELLSTLASLQVLNLIFSGDDAKAVLSHGLPAGLRVLGFAVLSSPLSAPSIPHLLEALPAGLVGLSFDDETKVSAVGVRRVLDRCPQLRVLELRLDHRAAEVLAAAEPLYVGTADGFGDDTTGVLEAAGHWVGNLVVGVHWAIGGGLVRGGEAVPV